jgi:protein regulator of cytokinesis 1
MKDLVVKKHEELMEIRRRARLPEDDDAAVMVLDAIDSGIYQLSTTRLNFFLA